MIRIGRESQCLPYAGFLYCIPIYIYIHIYFLQLKLNKIVNDKTRHWIKTNIVYSSGKLSSIYKSNGQPYEYSVGLIFPRR